MRLRILSAILALLVPISAYSAESEPLTQCSFIYLGPEESFWGQLRKNITGSSTWSKIDFPRRGAFESAEECGYMLASYVFANHQNYSGSFVLRDSDGRFVDQCYARHIQPVTEEVMSEINASIGFALVLEHHKLKELYRNYAKVPLNDEDLRSIPVPVFVGERLAAAWNQDLIDEHMEINCEGQIPGLE